MIKPANNKIIVKIIEIDETTPSGVLYIPDSAKEKPSKAEVFAVGENVENDISVGDTLFFSKYGGTDIEFQGEKFKVLLEEHILAIDKKGA